MKTFFYRIIPVAAVVAFIVIIPLNNVFSDTVTPYQNGNETTVFGFGDTVTPKGTVTGYIPGYGDTVTPKIPRNTNVPKLPCTYIVTEYETYNQFNTGIETILCGTPRVPRITPRVYPYIDPTPTPTYTNTPTPVLTPSVILKANNVDNAITITAGQPVTLSWNSHNVSTCQASLGWSGARGIGGALVIEGVYQTTTYRLTCSGQHGNAVDQVTVNVTQTQNPTLGVSLNTQPQSGVAPFTSTLTATLSGTATAPYTYKFDCTNNGNFETVRTISSRDTATTCTYNQAGTYIAKVIVDRAGVQSVSDTRTITVTNQNTTPTPTPTQTASINLSKTVRNVSQGNTTPTEFAYAQPNETLEFTIVARAQNNTVTNLRIVDSLPAGLSYVAGSTRQDDAFTLNDGITGNGVFLGTLFSGQEKKLTFRAVAHAPSQFNFGTTTLYNTAYAYSDAHNTSDTATIYVTRTQVIVPPQNRNTSLFIQKFGSNITKGESTQGTTLVASPRDTVEFIIKIRSTAQNTIDGIIVKDTLPNGLIYSNGTTSINGISTNDGIVSTNGLNIGSLSPNGEVTIRFSAVVTTSFARGTSYISNTVAALSNNVVISNVAQLPITITNGVTIGNPGNVPTGPVGSITIALMLATVATAAYAFYGQRATAQHSSLVALMQRQARDTGRFNFAQLV